MIAFLAEIVVKVTVLAGIGLALAAFLRRRSPAAAHMAWLAVVLGMLLLPVVALIGPRTYLPIAPSRGFRPIGSSVTPHVLSPKLQVNPASPDSGAGDSEVSTPERPFPWAETLIGIWFAGFLAVAARYAFAAASVRSIHRYATHPLDPATLPVNPGELAIRAGLEPNWELRQSATPELATAMTWGVLRPVVLLPVDAVNWSPQRLEAVLLHEFAHVRRHDFASQLLAELTCALYWFNPLAWLGARSMRADAESAADDSVLRSGLKASEYATELLQIAAEIGNRQTQLSRIGTPAMTQSKIETRLQAVLAPRARRRGVTSLEALFATVLALLSAAGIGSLQVGQAPAQGPRSQAESTEALIRLKQLALGTILYATDYDDVFPYLQSTASTKPLLAPYLKNMELFESPTPGGKFLLNLNVGGVRMGDVEKPAETPLWVERLTEKESRPGVAFVDGHAKLVDNLDPTLEKALKWKLPRQKSSKPLPPGYMINPGKPGN